jgi:hypothetical protein
MAIAFSCSCGRKINAKDEHAGKRVKCPGCQQPVTVPSAGAPAKPAAMASASAKAAAPVQRKPAAAKPAAPAPVDDDMYDIQDDAPPKKGRAAAAAAAASPWGDDDPGLEPVAAPRPYVSGAPAGAAPARATGGGTAAGAGAPAAAGGLGSFASLGSKRVGGPPAKGAKLGGGFHLGPMAKFLIGAAIILPTTFFIFKQGPVKAVAEWDKAGPAGEDDTRSVLMRVIHEMDVATMPPPDPDRDNRDGIPYHPEVSHFYYPDEPTIMWRMPDKVLVEGKTTFGPYEGTYFTRKRMVEVEMDWKGSDKLKVVGQLKPDGGVDKITIDGIDCMDHAALKKKFD